MFHRYALLAVFSFAMAGSTASADDAVPLGQLPDDVRPQRYRLALDIDPRKERYSGSVDIDVDIAKPVRTIWLHGRGLAVQAVTVESAGSKLDGAYAEVEPLTGVARVELPRELPAGRATLHFDYTSPFRESPDGLYRTKAGDDWYAFSQLEAIDARRVFPGFDEPRFKTSFEITVTAPASDKVVTNTGPTEETPVADGRIRHTFEPTLPLPTYLLAFAVGPLDIVDAPLPPNSVRSKPLTLRAVATRGRAPQLAYALKHTPEIVAALEQYFGIPYPYPKLDVIASPVHAGAMENAGAIIFSDSLLLLDDSARPSQQRSYFEVMAHEVAHHWFGDLVTPAWWDDIWLNESFAQWMGVKIADQLRPDLGSGAVETASVTYAMDVDSRRAGRPIHQRVTDNSQIESTFDAITYVKGGAVLSMIESYVGAETFRRGVQRHLRNHEHGVATSEEFFSAMAQAANQPAVMAAFRSFVDQPGVPLVSLDQTTGGTQQLNATQVRYLPIGTSLSGGERWQIPLCVHAYAGTAPPAKACTLLSQDAGRVTVPTETTALMPNAGGAGYYRFSLTGPQYDHLLARAVELPEREAIMFADSSAAAFRAGRLPFAQFLQAAARLSQHRSYVASTLPGEQLTDLRDRWLDAAGRAAMEARIRTIYAPRLAALGLDTRLGAYASEAAERRQLRAWLAALVATGGRDTGLRKQLADTARKSLADPAAVDPEFRSLAWAVGVQELGDSFARQLESALLASQDALLRSDAAWAIGSAETPQGSSRALALAARPDVRQAELGRLLYPQFGSPLTRDAAWTWLQDNFDHVLAKAPGIFKARYFQLLEPFCDAPNREQIASRLQDEVRKLGAGELEMQRTLEGIDLCIAQRAALGPSVSAALEAR